MGRNLASFASQWAPQSQIILAEMSHSRLMVSSKSRHSLGVESNSPKRGKPVTDTVQLPVMHWIWLTALSGIISNIGWELFNWFGHATIHSFSSAWHEFRKLPVHIFSLHAPFRIIGVVSAAMAVMSLVQASGGFEFGPVPVQLLEAYRNLAHGFGDLLFAAILNPVTRGMAYDTLIASFILVFVLWRTATGWHHYNEFQLSHRGAGESMSLGTYFGLQLLGGAGAVAIALAVLERL